MAAKEEKKAEVIDAVYKVNIHCQQCAREIKKPLGRAQGVHGVDVNIEKGEIKVKGVIDVIKVQKHIEKLSKKKVELISPKIKETVAVEKKVVKEIKQTKVHTTSVKINMHCDKCEHDLRQKLLKHKGEAAGIYSVKTDMKAQTLTVEGEMESEKVVAYLRKKVHQHAQIIAPKLAKKEEIKEKEVKVEAKTIESTKIVEFTAEKKVEVKSKESTTPYFIHYVYAPQLFSDENPNACSIM